MESALLQASESVQTLLGAVAVLLVMMGALHALFELYRLVFLSKTFHVDKREIYIHFAQWLVAALTFQLAADIVATTVAPGWDDIAKVAAVAVIRTFLTFFLDRDLESARRIRREEAGPQAGSSRD